MGKYVRNTVCPECGAGHGLAIYWDEERGENGTCHKCRAYFKDIEGGPDKSRNKRQSGGRVSFYKIPEIQGMPTADLNHRKIRREVCEEYGVKQDVTVENGETGSNIFFPAGVGSGYKRKNIYDKKDQQIIGEYKGLFGQQRFQAGGKFLIITEGEEDALAARQMLVDQGKNYAVVSLPNGAGCGGVEAKEVWDFICSFSCVLLVFDQDQDGHDGVEKFAGYFATEVGIKVAELPAKDANECLRQGQQNAFLLACQRAGWYRPEKLEKGEDVSFEEVYSPIAPGVRISTFPKLMQKMRGLRPEEMTLLLAPPGSGKTTVCREIVYDLLNQGCSVANIFLEEKTVKTRQGLIALDNNVPLWKFRENPDIIPKEKASESYSRLIGNNRCHFVKHRGSLFDSGLLSLVRWYKLVEKVDFVVLDHISMVFSGRRSNNERVEIDGLLTDLAALVEETGVHLIVVAHIKRMQGPKIYTQDKATGAEFLWIDLDAARGSGSFEQLAWNLITLEPQKPDTVADGEPWLTRISVRKNREVGFTGGADIYKVSPLTGRVETVEPEY